MPETRVIAKAVPKPGDKSQVKQLLRDMVAPSLAEPGVQTYDLHETTDGDAFYLFEIYESKEVFEKHKASEHFQKFERACCRSCWPSRWRSTNSRRWCERGGGCYSGLQNDRAQKSGGCAAGKPMAPGGCHPPLGQQRTEVVTYLLRWLCKSFENRCNGGVYGR